MIRISLLLLCISFCSIYIKAQPQLDNANFEGQPMDASVPMAWMPCALGSTPDILPGSWGVYNEAADGETFVGLITRQDGSWESIGQKFSEVLKAGDCYQFSVELAHSKTYANYNKPLKLKIWGGVGPCDKTVLLAESPTITHTQWKRYYFDIEAEVDLQYFLIEAYFMDGVYFDYNGNILVDRISKFKPCIKASRERAIEKDNKFMF